MLEPYLTADGDPTDNRGPRSSTRRRSRVRRRARRGRLPGALPRDRRPGRARVARRASRRRGGRTARPTTRHHIAHLQVIHPDDVPRSARSASWPTPQPLWAAHEAADGRADDPVPGRRARRWQYPFRLAARAGARARDGQRLARSRRRTRSGGWTSRVDRATPAGHRGDGRRVPARRALDLVRRARGVHRGFRLREPPRRRHGHDRGRQARRPGRARPRPVRPRAPG